VVCDDTSLAGDDMRCETEELLEKLKESADFYYQQYRTEMQLGHAEWALKYEWVWHGYTKAIREAEDFLAKRRIPV
jgi:hypothetical protein